MLPFGAQRRALTPSEGGSDLYRLFANGEDGFLFGNFGDLTRLFTSFNGNTNVANDADPVGLALEDAKWSKRTYSAQLAQAAESIRNQNGNGAVPGTPGTPPDNWTASVQTGYAWTMVGRGTDSDGAYTEYQLDGNDASLRACNLIFETSTQIVAASGEVWVNDVGIKVTAGSLTGVAMSLQIDENTAAGAFVANGNRAITPTGTMQRFPLIRALSGGATVGRAVPFVRFSMAGGVAVSVRVRIYAPSMKKVAGNHGSQTTSSARPFYKPNSGKPYLLFDGSDDTLITPFKPTTAMTFAAAFQPTNANSFAIGGGDSANNRRALIGTDVSGKARMAWGNISNYFPGDRVISNTDCVLLGVGDATSMSLYLNGELLGTQAATGPSGATTGIALGSYNNGGTPSNFMSGRIYGALAINRVATASEIAMITAKLRSTYQ